MTFFSGLLSCFSSNGVSSRVRDDANKLESSVEKNKKKSLSAPIILSYFPINSPISRL
ncbi:hypothetical protein R3W88_002000 [Solanum pinnatisectum]|uniref:Uncharacterized protein n=1 Tax=Solanum pinnatisectum TaxID=50273 RepID=A0AAV9MKF6_9SOLN|nr:hypothetical protein R3W88_002000 [Solanum pinnatisectum]